MDQAGALADGFILDDGGFHTKQVFMDQNLVECSCSNGDRKTQARVVFSNAQWTR